MDSEEINNIMRELGLLQDMESVLNERSQNSEIENQPECVNTNDSDDITVNSTRSASQNINNVGDQQEAVTPDNQDCVNIDLPRCSANDNTTHSSPPDVDRLNLNDPMELLKALLDETNDAAEIMAAAGPENMFKLLFEPNPMNYDNPTEIISPLLNSVPIQSGSQTCECCKAKGAPSDSNPTLSTEPETRGTKSDNLDRMGVVNEILRQILAPTSMFIISPQHGARNPSSGPYRRNQNDYDHLTVILAFIILTFILLKFCY